jgi:MFS family permease
MRVTDYTEFKAGWPVVLSSLLGIGLGLSPLPFYTLGAFAPHLMKTFHWSLVEIFSALPITTLVVLVAGPAAGFLAGRFGARLVAITSLVLFAFSYMSLGFSNGSLTLYYIQWAVAALVGAGTLPITWTVAVNQRFDRRKGLALGISMMGTGIFGFFCKPLIAWLIPTFGWRGAFVGIGLLPILIALPAAMLLYRERPISESTPAQLRASASPTGLSFAETIKTWRFWLIALVLIPVSFALSGPLPNMETILTKAGFAGPAIVKLASLIGLSALVGRLVGGWLLDLFWAPAIALFLFAVPGVASLLLAQPHLSTLGAALAIFLVGFSVGVEYDLVAYLVARYFGMRDYTAIYGLLYVFFALGAGVSSPIFGWSVEKTGSYRLILEVGLCLLVVGGLSLLTLGKYRYARAAGEIDPVAEGAPVTA